LYGSSGWFSTDAVHQRKAGLGIRLSRFQKDEKLFLLLFAGFELVDQVVSGTRHTRDGKEQGC